MSSTFLNRPDRTAQMKMHSAGQAHAQADQELTESEFQHDPSPVSA